MKVAFFSFAVNDKFPFDIQYRQFKKYCPNDEFILFNDAVDDQMAQNITTAANGPGMPCVRVPQSIHKIQNPSEGYATTLNWALHQYAVQNHHEVVVLMHSDIFPIRPVSVLDILENYLVASVMESRPFNGQTVHYLYPAFTIVNVARLGQQVGELNFECALGLDTGGKTHSYVMNNLDKVKFLENHQIPNIINTLSPGLQEYFNEDMKICADHGLNKGWVAEGFYHYLAGSQWNALDDVLRMGHQKRMELFLKYFY